MFTVYVDDSGSAPDQKLAIAGALIVPTVQISRMEMVWRSFRDKYGFSDLHASACVARNTKEGYGNWSDNKVDRVLSRARNISKRHASKAFAFAIHKDDFDSLAPKEWRDTGGENHYTWALRILLTRMVEWHRERKIQKPFEFVFDNADGKAKDEIEMLMSQFESVFPGQFEGHFSFRKREDVPALQCADLLAWCCYCKSLNKFKGRPVSPFAIETFKDFSRHLDRDWLEALTSERKQLQQAIEKDRADGEAERTRREWREMYKARRNRISGERRAHQ